MSRTRNSPARRWSSRRRATFPPLLYLVLFSTVTLFTATSVGTTAYSQSSPVLGGPCAKAGSTIGGGPGVTWVCTKKGATLVWQKLAGQTGTPVNTPTKPGIDPTYHTPCKSNPHPVFTANLTDPNDIRLIQPLGLGEVEPRFRTFLWIDTAVAPAKIPIYAPIAGNFVNGVYKDVKGLVDYDLHFVVSCQIWFTINHVSNPIAAIRQDLPSTPQVGTTQTDGVPVKHILHFKAGQLIGYTTGTTLAHDFDFGVFDTTHVNKFSNLTRFKVNGANTKYLTAVCPYDFFTPAKRAVWYSKFGETSPVPNATCGQINQDVAGTIAGMWFAGGTSVGSLPVNLMVGVYIDGSIQISGQDISPIPVIDQSNPTYATPASVTTQHCYAQNNEYYFFNVLSATEIQLSSGTGTCPATFSSTGAKNYFR
jgi:hypothetical protein